jgi:5'-3' exonuclease
MGIKCLSKFLRDKYPNVFEEIHISEYAYKKVAIDISLYLCKFKTVCGINWISAFINLVTCLRKNDVHCVFIYDTSSPIEKSDEKAKRREQNEKSDEKVYQLEEALEHYYKTNQVQNILIELDNKRKIKTPPKILNNNKNNEEKKINIKLIEQEILRLRQQVLHITPEDFELTKKLFDILNVPYYDAPMEAETTCSDLCKRDIVDAVLSEDTDVLAYGTPTFLCKIDTTENKCLRVNKTNLLNELGLTYEEFLDFCIMCGTDYNKNIFKIGPDKAYKLIKQYSTIENINKNTQIDISILNHIRVRDIFTNYQILNIKQIPYCGCPYFDDLQLLINKNNLNINLEKLKKSFTTDIIIIDVNTEENATP